MVITFQDWSRQHLRERGVPRLSVSPGDHGPDRGAQHAGGGRVQGAEEGQAPENICGRSRCC